MRKLFIISALICLVAGPCLSVEPAMAQEASESVQGIVLSSAGPDSSLAKIYAERDKLITKINKLNADLNRLLSKSSADPKKVAFYRNRLRELQLKLQENMQKELDIRRLAGQAHNQASEMYQADSAEGR